MKKLLILLGSSFISVAPIATVIACTDTSSNNENKDGDILNPQNPRLKLDAEKLLDIILKNGEDKLITNGEPKKTLQNFMSHFAFGLEKNIDELVKAHPEITSGYENDKFVDAIKDLYNNLNRRAQNAWDDYLKEKRRQHSDDDKKVLEDLQKEFDRKYSQINDFKDDYIYRYAVQGAGNTALRDILNLVVEDFAKSTGFISATSAITTVNSLFRGKPEFGGVTVDFETTAIKASGPDDQRDKTWFGQFDNYLKGLRTLSKETEEEKVKLFKESAASLISLVNATGGLKLEEFLTNNPDATNMLVDDVTWLTFNNIKEILSDNDADIIQWSNKLLKRFDTNYNEHFNSNNSADKNETIDGWVLALSAKGVIPKLGVEYSQLFENIPNINNNEPTSDQLTGLFSNSQRYFTNLYFNQKKPIAVTEFLVKPWVEGTDIPSFDKEITNSPYISKTSEKYHGLYNFINTFVTSNISQGNTPPSNTPADYTKVMFENESNYSWDVLLQNKGSLNNIQHGNENTENGWVPDSQLWYEVGQNISLVDHDNLLTVDSKNYSETLKYAIYDFLQKPEAEKTEFNAWKADDGRTKYNKDFDLSDLDANNVPFATPISSLIHSLDRSDGPDATTKTEKNVYQILNAEQGIIAFTADDGIHFVRIEGYKLIKDANNSSSDYLKEQSKLTINDDQYIKNYETYHQLSVALNSNRNEDVVKRAAEGITFDYLNRDSFSQNLSKIKYQDLNNSFGNKYLEFLANTSILSSWGNGNSKYTYKLQNEVQNWLSTTATTSDKYWVAVWDYIKELFNIESDEEIYDTFFKINKEEDDKTKKLASKYKKIILDTLNLERRNIFGNSEVELLKQWNSYVDKYENRISNPQDGIHYRPWNYLSTGTNFSKISAIESSNIWKYDNKSTTFTIKFSLDINKYLTKTNLIEVTNNNKAIIKESRR